MAGRTVDLGRFGKRTVYCSGFDFSYDRPSPATIAARKQAFVVRYLSDGAKGLTQAEVDGLNAHHVGIVLVYEIQVNAPLGGHARGVQDARFAQGRLNLLHGISHALPIYFAVDFDATEAQQAAINAYLDGVASVIGRARTGVYGGFWVVSRAMAAGHARWGWQAFAWSGANLYAGAHLFQYQNGVALKEGGTVDLVVALQPEYGQHPVPTAPTAAQAAAAKAAADKAAAAKAAADKAAAQRAAAERAAAAKAAADKAAADAAKTEQLPVPAPAPRPAPGPVLNDAAVAMIADAVVARLLPALQGLPAAVWQVQFPSPIADGVRHEVSDLILGTRLDAHDAAAHLAAIDAATISHAEVSQLVADAVTTAVPGATQGGAA